MSEKVNPNAKSVTEGATLPPGVLISGEALVGGGDACELTGSVAATAKPNATVGEMFRSPPESLARLHHLGPEAAMTAHS